MLQLNNLYVTLNKNTQLARPILQNLHLSIADGEFVVLIGSNGCGKSTLMNTIAGYIRPDQGQVIIDNQDVTNLPQTRRSSVVALVMQEPRLGTMENMTLEENLSFAYMRGKVRQLKLHNSLARRNLFKDRLAMLGMNLENRLEDLVGNLSGGQRQALSLIMAIITDYKILLLDEITAALDPKTADTVMAIAAKLVREEKRTALMITHNMQHALHYGDRTLVMANGQLLKAYNKQDRSTLTPAGLAMAM